MDYFHIFISSAVVAPCKLDLIAPEIVSVISSNSIFRDGQPYIYVVMDWKEPKKAVCFIIGALVLATLIHFALFIIFKLRVFVQRRYFTNSTDRNQQIVLFD